MTDTLLSLGGFTFSGWSIPERISGGGKQRLAIHRLTGGARVIDVMGWDANKVGFSGRFRGAAAMSGIRLLETLARVGVPVVLSYWTNRYQVLVGEFSWQFERYYEISYTLSLEVLADLTQDAWQFATESLDDLFNADFSLLNLVIGAGSGLPVSLANVASAQAQIGVLQEATPSELLPLGSTVAATSVQLQNLTSTFDAALPAGSAGGVGSTGDPAALASGLTAQAANFQQLAGSVQASAIVTRMQVNLGATSV
jgi:hypothetical protein